MMNEKSPSEQLQEELEPLPTAVQLPARIEELGPAKLAKLAREVAMDVKDLPVILGHYNLTVADFERLKENEFFKRALEAVTIEWNSALSTHDRIKIEAAAILEDNMPALSARMVKNEEPLNAAVEAGKLFAKIAGIGDGAKEAHPGEKFTININLGADTKLHFEKDITPDVPLIEKKETP